MLSPILAAVLLLTSTAATAQQSHKVLMLAGEDVYGLGALDSVFGISVNDSGEWVATILTENGQALVGNDGVLSLPGAPVPGAERDVSDWVYVDLDPKGIVSAEVRSFDLALRPIYQGFVIKGSETLWVGGQPYRSEHLGLGSYLDFGGPVYSARNAAIVLGQVRNTNIPRLREQCLVRFDLDRNGAVTGSEILATEEMYLEKLDVFMRWIGPQPNWNSPHALKVNGSGSIIASFLGRTRTGDSLEMIAKDFEEVIAIQDGPAPAQGRTWRHLTRGSIALSDSGGYAHSGVLDVRPGAQSIDVLIVKNGDPFVMTGDVLPEFSDEPLGGEYWEDPMYLASDDTLFWRASAPFDEPDALMRERTPIVHEGRTVLGGRTVARLYPRHGEQTSLVGFDVSPSGRYVLVHCGLAADPIPQAALILIDLGPRAVSRLGKFQPR